MTRCIGITQKGWMVWIRADHAFIVTRLSATICQEEEEQGRIHGHQLQWAGAEMRVFPLFDSMVTDRRTDGRTDKRTDGRTDGQSLL